MSIVNSSFAMIGKLQRVHQRIVFFSQTLDVCEYSTTDKDREKLWSVLNKLTEKREEKKDVVLLFDESQHLIKNGDGWHFRSIRWWLRLPPRDEYDDVVCVFAGTNTSLANYFAEPKQQSTSRDARFEYNKGNKPYPPFYEITTTVRGARAIVIDGQSRKDYFGASKIAVSKVAKNAIV